MSVREAIEIGSIHRSLYHRFVSPISVLEYLLEEREVTPRRLAAYKAVCKITDTNSILIDDRTFLEIYNPIEYQLVTIFSNNCSSLRDRRDWKFLQTGIEAIVNDNFSTVRIKCIFFPGSILSDEFSGDILYNDIPILDPSINIDDLLSCDHGILMTISNSIDIDKMLRRCTTLIETSPLYWRSVARSLYLAIVRVSKSLSYQDHRRIIHIFPEYCPEWLHDLDETSYIIYNMSSPLREYYLGLDILNSTTSESIIRRRLLRLSSLGIEDYCEECRISNMTTSVNDTNLFGDDIDEYSPFDRIHLQENDKIYTFTREEFDHIHSKNPYTNTSLPIGFLYTLSSRSRFAKDYIKVEPATLNTLMRRLTNIS